MMAQRASTRTQHLANHVTSGGSAFPLPLTAVVKIFTKKLTSDFANPWQRMPQSSSTGSGFAIKGRLILTNSHVVFSASSVRVRRHGKPGKFKARVLCVGRQCDLALLTVDEDIFWEGLNPVEFSDELPQLDSNVTAVGYPMGGDNVSVTRGIVSRIDLLNYTLSQLSASGQLLVIQIDAAINPGNSGGAVFDQNNQVVGVAFAGIGMADNIGYVIPVAVVQLFLQSFASSGVFQGVPTLGVSMQRTEGEAIRRKYNLSTSGANSRLGIIITSVAPQSCLLHESTTVDVLDEAEARAVMEALAQNEDREGYRVGDVASAVASAAQRLASAGSAAQVGDYPAHLSGPPAVAAVSADGGGSSDGGEDEEASSAVVQSGDTLLAIDGIPLADDGTIRFRGDQRLMFAHLVTSEGVKARAELLFQRGHEIRRVHCIRRDTPKLVPQLDGVDATPSYAIIGGCVFVPLTIPWISRRYGSRSSSGAPAGLINKLSEPQEAPGEQVVVLGKVLAAEVNYGHQEMQGLQLIEYNGQRVNNLAALWEMARRGGSGTASSGGSSDDAFHTFRFANESEIVLDAAECAATEAEVLELHAIPLACSADLRA
jgi:S1-C subfamily serine protease